MRAGGRNEAELVGDGCTGALLTPGEGRRGFPPGEGEAAVGCTGALPTLGEGRRWISRGEAGLTARGSRATLTESRSAGAPARRAAPPRDWDGDIPRSRRVPAISPGDTVLAGIALTPRPWRSRRNAVNML